MNYSIYHIKFWASRSLLIVFSIIHANTYSQDVPDSLIQYSSDFKFTEGVYLNFDDVKRNIPIPKSRILSEYNYSDKDFFEKTLVKNKFYFYDNLGAKVEVRTSGVWGYSRNGFLYINIDRKFFRITLIGSICHFVAFRTYENYSNQYYNPYYSNYPYTTRVPTTSTTDMEQYILAFSSGNVVDYSVEGIEVALMTDPELHDEYMALSKKKKKQLKFVYIRRFNERNPLYLIKK